MMMQQILKFLRFGFFFILGFSLTGALLSTLLYLGFTLYFQNKVYPGVKIAGTQFGNASKTQIESYFVKKDLSDLEYNFEFETATVSAKGTDLNLDLDTNLMVSRALSIGRQTKNPYHNLLQIYSAWQGEIDLPLEINADSDILPKILVPIVSKIVKEPVNAVYTFDQGAGADKRGRVVAFQKSQNGQAIDFSKLAFQIHETAVNYYFNSTNENRQIRLSIPTKIVPPIVASSTADDLGIKDLLGRGESYFYDSIPGRVYNIGLGTQKVNGRLVAPNEIFSFDEAIGTVSAVFGFQKAYAIVRGKTVLDDGGGVCQVSTTLYRAVLNAGLPIVERVGHSYRVGFYEQGGFLPGMDATVYPPSPDFRFRNDTGKTILIQATYDKEQSKLTFELFGTNDGRKTTITGPVVTAIIPAGEPIYEDDPNLPTGQIKQTETAHSGAKVYFKRQVTRDNQELINETVTTDYVPWPARYLKGTKT